MAGVRLDGDIERLKQTLRNMEGINLTEINEVIGDALKSSSILRFDSETGPEGEKWKKSIRAINEGGKTLTDNSLLKTSINVRTTEQGVAVGTNDIRAGTLQEGGEYTIRAKNAKVLKFKVGGKWISKKEVKVKMPSRKFIGISNDDQQEIKAIMEDAIKEQIK